MWCMLAAPLIAGNDLRSMTPETLNILTNRDVLAVDQDRLGVTAFVYSSSQGMEVWFKPLEGDAWAMCVLNRTGRPQKFQFDWKKEIVNDDLLKREAHFDTVTCRIRDLWTKKNLGTTAEPLNAEVPSHDVLMMRLDKM
jgi:alpha-galactosidase